MTRRARWTHGALALFLPLASACLAPRTPRAAAPYTVRLLGASDDPLRGIRRGERSIFAGEPGRDYAVEVVNDTSANVAIAVIIDGLDARTGEPVTSCQGLGGWVVEANAQAVVRGFAVSDTHLVTYRFAPPERSLAAITKGARREAIGTVEVCISSLRPRRTPIEVGPSTFRGVVESEPSSGSAPVVGELRDDSGRKGFEVEMEHDQLLQRIVVGYETTEGAPLGTAPPPAGIAKVDPGRRDLPLAAPPNDGAATDQETKPSKPTKPTKAPKPTTTPKGLIKGT